MDSSSVSIGKTTRQRNFLQNFSLYQVGLARSMDQYFSIDPMSQPVLLVTSCASRNSSSNTVEMAATKKAIHRLINRSKLMLSATKIKSAALFALELLSLVSQ